MNLILNPKKTRNDNLWRIVKTAPCDYCCPMDLFRGQDHQEAKIERMEIDRELLERALVAYGLDAQIDKVVEECAELIHSLMKLKLNWSQNGGSLDRVYSEIADAYIMIEQASIIFGETAVQKYVDSKQNRLRTRLEMFEKPETVGKHG